MTRLALLTVLSLGLAQITACGGDSNDSAGGAGSAGVAGSAAAGSAGGAGGTAGAAGVGGSGGVGGTLSATRKCGDGEPCSVGASCAYSGIESGVRCECDASRHFLCDAWSSAGAPPFEACNENTREPGAGGGSGEPFSCSHTNGYCTRTCSEGSCTVTCEGSGPAEPEPGMECAASYCDQDYWGWGGCEMADGDSCNYQLDCGGPGVVTSIEGSCE